MLTLNDGWLGDGLAFPDFDKILDFTSAGSESSTSVNVNGDTDLEYKIIANNLDADYYTVRLNDDTTLANYGGQYLINSAGTISAWRGTTGYILPVNALTLTDATILTPAGFTKTCFRIENRYTSGTTIGLSGEWGLVWNSTANVTKISFVMSSGNFTSGTRIIVYRRRVNT
jgi:hypothetical protein